MKAKVHVSLKDGVLDPQGRAIKNALNSIGFDGISEVRQGKYIEIFLNTVQCNNPLTKLCDILESISLVLNFYDIKKKSE